MTGRLTTHVLDTAQGKPAGGLRLALWRITGPERELLAETVTNPDGRTDAPLLTGDALRVGTYEIVFEVGDYFATQPVAAASPPFLGSVPVRFSIADASAHYHVPLLASPWAYSTYRGS
jgi:5-hydroxyisourate hydrolase